MKTLVIDIGGTNVKLWKRERSKKHPSGKELSPQHLVDLVRPVLRKGEFDRISIGYPGDVRHGRPAAEPWNLGPGWVGFDWSDPFGCPLRIMNDACMQALGSYEGGRMLYLGLGTAIGTALVVDGKVVSLALGHLQFRTGTNFDQWLGREGLQRHGLKEWHAAVLEAGGVLKAAFQADYVVFGGGNAKKLASLPDGFRKGGNHNAWFGGLRMWEDAAEAGLPEFAFPEPLRQSRTAAPGRGRRREAAAGKPAIPSNGTASTAGRRKSASGSRPRRP